MARAYLTATLSDKGIESRRRKVNGACPLKPNPGQSKNGACCVLYRGSKPPSPTVKTPAIHGIKSKLSKFDFQKLFPRSLTAGVANREVVVY